MIWFSFSFLNIYNWFNATFSLFRIRSYKAFTDWNILILSFGHSTTHGVRENIEKREPGHGWDFDKLTECYYRFHHLILKWFHKCVYRQRGNLSPCVMFIHKIFKWSNVNIIGPEFTWNHLRFRFVFLV